MMWFDALTIHPPPEPLESFTGYLVRLAQTNAIRSKSALSAVAFPRLKRKANWTDLPRPSYGALPEAAACTQAQLHATTFYHLLHKFQRSVYPGPAKIFLAAVLSPNLRYCPVCLAETGFYKLSWRFTYLAGCAEHAVYLLDRCGHCGALVPLVPTPLRVGICPTCGGDLWTCPVPPLTDQQRVQEIADDLSFLLSPQPWEDGPAALQAFGPALVNLRREQGWSAEAMAAHLDLSIDALQAVEGRKAVGRGETFADYLRYLAVFDLSFREGFAHAQRLETLDVEQQWVERVQYAIATLKRDEQPLTQQSICRLLQCSPKTLRQFPRVTSILHDLRAERKAQRHLEGKPVGSRKHRGQSMHLSVASQFASREERYLTQAKAAVEQMRAAGIPFSCREVARQMGMSAPGLRSYPRIAAFLADCLQEAQLSTKATWHERVEQATQELQARQQPVTQCGVADLLGMSAQRLRHHAELRAYLATFADYNAELHAKQQQERETALHEAVTAVIQQMRSDGQRVTQVGVAAALDTSAQRLKSYKSIRPLIEEIARHARHK